MAHTGECRNSSTIFDLCTRWMWVVSFTPWPLYYQRKIPWYPLDRSLSGPQSQSGRCGAEKKSLAPAGNRTPAVQPLARLCTDWAIPLLKSMKVYLIIILYNCCQSYVRRRWYVALRTPTFVPENCKMNYNLFANTLERKCHRYFIILPARRCLEYGYYTWILAFILYGNKF
jgi:hypothetical protein